MEDPKTAGIIPFEGPRDLAAITARPPLLFLPEPKASERFWEFFTANIRNRNTRCAYYKAACRFSEWCEGHGLHDLARVKPIHVAAFVEELLQALSKPTVKQHPQRGQVLHNATRERRAPDLAKRELSDAEKMACSFEAVRSGGTCDACQ
jgi:hypothetical protein